MKQDIEQYVRGRLAAAKGRWKVISQDLAPHVSYSMISKMGRGEYTASPTHKKLKILAEYFRSRKHG